MDRTAQKVRRGGISRHPTLQRRWWSLMPQLGTVRKHGGGGIGDSRYFAGTIDNNGTSGKQENGEAPAIPCPSCCLSCRNIRTPAKVFGPFRTSCPHHHCAGATVPRPCRADLASGYAGTLCGYTSIPRDPGEQAQEESAGQHRVVSLLGWSTRAMGSGFLVRSRSL